jgi:hypothetical protein
VIGETLTASTSPRTSGVGAVAGGSIGFLILTVHGLFYYRGDEAIKKGQKTESISPPLDKPMAGVYISHEAAG